MHVSSGLDHMLTSNHRGRGHDPVTVLGRIRFFVTVRAIALLGIRLPACSGFYPTRRPSTP
jgi:hypothetical protein